MTPTIYPTSLGPELKKYFWGLLLLGLGWAQVAAGQTTVMLPLAKEADFNQYIRLDLDSTQHLRHLPKGLRQYMLKYVVVGGLPGQPPAQRLNFLIGRDKQGRIVFVPAEPGTLKLRLQDKQVLPAIPGESQPKPFQLVVRGLRGPMVLTLRPQVYLPKNMTLVFSWKNDLLLMLERASATSGSLKLNTQEVALRATTEGSKSLLVFTDSVTFVSVLDGQHKNRRYRMGESFLANGHLVKLQHISSGGDSLTVQITEPIKVAPVFGKDPGLAFRPATLTDVQGQAIQLLGTERPLVLDFWGTWCGPCVALTPALKTLHQQYAAKADIVSIALDDANKVRQYLANNGIQWTNIAIPEKHLASLIEDLSVNNYPTFILIHKGIIRYRGTGEAGLQELTHQLAQLR